MSPAKFYPPTEISTILEALGEPRAYKSGKIYTLDVVTAFDIETTSFKNEQGEKIACMYVWQLALEDYVIVGRTWDEYLATLETISTKWRTSPTRRLQIWVHNLAYEFAFIAKRHTWSDVFAVDARKPVRALTDNGIEFRCSLILSGYSLANLGKQLTTHKVRKAVGDLDYSKPRHYLTPMTPEELGYCVNDVRVVVAYINERKDEEGGRLDRIPLTKTGYVRRYCKNACLGKNAKTRTKEQEAYARTMKDLTLTTLEHKLLRAAFQGGFTHANPFYVGQTLESVSSYDFTSSYPTVMISERYPMGKPQWIDNPTPEKLQQLLQNNCLIMTLEFGGLRPKLTQDNPISSSHCTELEGAVVYNGRVASARRLITTCTDVDLQIYQEFYEWDSLKVSDVIAFKKDYLPTPFVKSIIKLYKDKTQLKGVAGREADYMVAKGMLNSTYGMTVTAIVKDDDIYDNDEGWGVIEADVEESINKYNDNPARFLYYAWGVWITAYARRALFTGIAACGMDYIYADTDSIKILNADKHLKYIEAYNKRIIDRLETAMDFHGLPYEDIAPKSVDGVSHPLGVWDYEGTYRRFKTLGAKRYLVEHQDGSHGLTVAGLGKRSAVAWMESQGDDVFTVFDTHMTVPAGDSGRITHTYIDYLTNAELTDYTGVAARVSEETSVHLEEAPYTLEVSASFFRRVLKLRETR